MTQTAEFNPTHILTEAGIRRQVEFVCPATHNGEPSKTGAVVVRYNLAPYWSAPSYGNRVHYSRNLSAISAIGE